MNDSLQALLDQALVDKKLNQTAYNQIVRWLTEPEFIEFVPQLTLKIEQADWDNLLDQFYRVVSFGTGGIRGVMDLGTNRLNNYTIRWATQAFAQYLLIHQPELATKGVAIANDSRHHSEEFVHQSASVLAGNGIPVYIFDNCRATPELSFTVRQLGLVGGIVVTASHNPPQFNGWKVYDQHGVQVMPDQALLIEEQFKKVDSINKVEFSLAQQQGLVKVIGPEVDQAFLADAKKVSTYANKSTHIVYSPLHGVGSMNVLPALRESGFTNISLVEEQMSLDGDFPTVKDHFPQPEFPVVYEPAIALAKQVNANIVLVSDPDADRLGMAIPDANKAWTPLSGNQAGVLMAAFYLQQLQKLGRLQPNSVAMKTTVTTELIRDICESYGVKVIGDLLVGFKFIGDRLEHLPSDQHFLFGAEESIGYLFTTAYRDKGAESPAIIAAEMAAWAKDQGFTLPEYLDKLYQEYGYYAEKLHYKLIEGLGAIDQMNIAMQKLRDQLPKEIAGQKVIKVMDRLTGQVHDGQTNSLIETRDWDKGDMLSFFFSEDERTAIHVRPSGTEPKMKYYTMVKGKLQDRTKEQITQQATEMEAAIVKIFDDILATVHVDVFS